jgi:hypothetical protein
MHKHAVRQAAATTGSPSGGSWRPFELPAVGGSSRGQRRAGSIGPCRHAGAPDPRGTRRDRPELTSHFSLGAHRNLGSAFARLWSRMMPEPPPPQSDLPTKIWFPWFLP